MPINLWRACGRPFSMVRTEGFTAWNPLTTTVAQAMFSRFNNSKEFERLSNSQGIERVKERWPSLLMAKKRTLTDLMRLIKQEKDKNSFWISTAINEHCGGYADGKTPVYKMQFEQLYCHKSNPRGANVSEAEKITENSQFNIGRVKPSLITDSGSLSTSSLVALAMGPTNDAEFAFLTTIPPEAIIAKDGVNINSS